MHPSRSYAAHYRAFLVRIWRDTPGAAWHASAQSTQSGKIVRFGTLEALFEFLEEATESAGKDASSTGLTQHIEK